MDICGFASLDAGGGTTSSVTSAVPLLVRCLAIIIDIAAAALAFSNIKLLFNSSSGGGGGGSGPGDG